MATSIDDLRQQVRGEVITAEDASYDEARTVYNAMIDRRPEVVIRALDVADVVAGVNMAREAGLDLSVRGGGHSVPGFGTNDGGIVLDLSPMKGVRVDPDSRTARAGGGNTWGDYDHATHAFGLASTGGVVSTTGIAGLTLGGGIGYLARKHGLSCDNLISADVVTADGGVRVASADQNEDLFWAIRGGGGNFGVVTSLEYRVHPLEQIYGGPIFFDVDRARDVLAFYREYISKAPEEFDMVFAWQIAPPLPFIPDDRHGDTMCAIVACWSGPVEEGPAMIQPIRDAVSPVAEFVDAMPYPALNGLFDALLPPGLQHYWKADFVNEITDAAIDVHLDHGPKVPVVQSTMHLYPIDGAAHRVASDDTAFAYRDANFAMVIAGMWPDPNDNEAHTRWVRDYFEAIHPHSAKGAYVNFLSGDDQGRIRENYAGNYDRLARIKAEVDPGNLFHMNQNIAPA